MKWPWQRVETRSSSYSDQLVQLLQSQASGSFADIGSTAAVEAASGALSRAFASARPQGPPHVQDACTPAWMAQVGRDLVRSGQSLSVIDVSPAGRVSLIPSGSWDFDDGEAQPSTWTVRATISGPRSQTTLRLPFAGVVFVKWGSHPGIAHRGKGPLGWASTTARLGSETERSIADEAGGPIANLLPVPQDGGDGTADDPLATLKADIKAARGRALLVETTSGGWDGGPGGAPRRDWIAGRLGPAPPAALVEVMTAAFNHVLAATGTPPSLFASNAQGVAQREAIRRWHLGTVLPLARLVEVELSEKLEAAVTLKFDGYALDLAGRAQAFQKLVAGGMAIQEALAVTGLLSATA